MVAIIVAATATIIYCYINRFDPQEYVQAFLDVSYKQKTESYIKQTGISEKEAKQIFEDNLDYTIEKFPEHVMTDEMAGEYRELVCRSCKEDILYCRRSNQGRKWNLSSCSYSETNHIAEGYLC